MSVGTPLGCEAAVHATREFLTASTSASAADVEVGEQNAFNTVRRNALLTCIRGRCPDISARFPGLQFSIAASMRRAHDSVKLRSPTG